MKRILSVLGLHLKAISKQILDNVYCLNQMRMSKVILGTFNIGVKANSTERNMTIVLDPPLYYNYYSQLS
jgi:hypothetical protein